MYLGYECTLLCLLDFIIEYPHLTSGLVHPAHQLADCCIICLHLHTHTQMCPIHLHTQNDLSSSPKFTKWFVKVNNNKTHKYLSSSPTHTQRCVLFTYTHKMICRLYPKNLFVIFNNVNSLSSSLTHIDVVFTNIHATLCHPHQNKNWLIDFT